eukprot:gene19454-26117_t
MALPPLYLPCRPCTCLATPVPALPPLCPLCTLYHARAAPVPGLATPVTSALPPLYLLRPPLYLLLATLYLPATPLLPSLATPVLCLPPLSAFQPLYPALPPLYLPCHPCALSCHPCTCLATPVPSLATPVPALPPLYLPCHPFGPSSTPLYLPLPPLCLSLPPVPALGPPPVPALPCQLPVPALPPPPPTNRGSNGGLPRQSSLATDMQEDSLDLSASLPASKFASKRESTNFTDQDLGFEGRPDLQAVAAKLRQDLGLPPSRGGSRPSSNGAPTNPNTARGQRNNSQTGGAHSNSKSIRHQLYTDADDEELEALSRDNLGPYSLPRLCGAHSNSNSIRHQFYTDADDEELEAFSRDNLGPSRFPILKTVEEDPSTSRVSSTPLISSALSTQLPTQGADNHHHAASARQLIEEATRLSQASHLEAATRLSQAIQASHLEKGQPP